MVTENKKVVYLIRNHFSDQGTEGVLIAPSFSCFTLELPWRDNKPNISCIPPGEYEVEPWVSKKYKKAFHLKDVPNRSYILMHSGNFAGDIYKGYRAHVQGCILLGKKFGYLNGQRAILNSRITVNEFIEEMDFELFKLVIKNI